MIYIKIWGDCGYSGTDFEEAFALDEEATEDEIAGICSEIAYEHAADYEYLAEGWDEEAGDFVTPQARHSYYEGYDYQWKRISVEEYAETI